MAVYVKFLGKSEWCPDRFFGTGAIFRGHGDIQEIEDEIKGTKLGAFQPSFCLSSKEEYEEQKFGVKPKEEEPAKRPSSGILIYEPAQKKDVPIEKASIRALHASAKKHGVTVPKSMSKDDLIENLIQFIIEGKDEDDDEDEDDDDAGQGSVPETSAPKEIDEAPPVF